MAASTSSGRRVITGISDRNSRQRAEPDGKVRQQRIQWVGSSDWRRRDGSDIRYQSSDRRGCRSSDQRRNLGYAFQRIVRVENGGVVSSRSSGAVSEVELEGDLEMCSDQMMFEASKAVDISHHASRPMENLEEVTEKLLGPTADLMNRPIIFQNFLNGAAIAEPKEFRTPKEFPILANGPTTTSGLTNERVKMAFSLAAAARAKSNRAQASSVHSEVEGAYAIGVEQRKRHNRSFGVVGLH